MDCGGELWSLVRVAECFESYEDIRTKNAGDWTLMETAPIPEWQPVLNDLYLSINVL